MWVTAQVIFVWICPPGARCLGFRSQLITYQVSDIVRVVPVSLFLRFCGVCILAGLGKGLNRRLNSELVPVQLLHL
jgi:hypothetical protein